VCSRLGKRADGEAERTKSKNSPRSARPVNECRSHRVGETSSSSSSNIAKPKYFAKNDLGVGRLTRTTFFVIRNESIATKLRVYTYNRIIGETGKKSDGVICADRRHRSSGA